MNLTTERVTFESAGETLVGVLHLPAAPRADRLPAVVVAGAWGTVKEQMATGYAREMAARGFAALAFDFRSWGESSGSPRSMEDPLAKAADIAAAAAFLADRDDDDANAIGGLGICAGSAYLATAATQSDLIKSDALIAPALPSRETTRATLGGQPGVDALLAMAHAADGEQLVPAVEPPGGDYYGSPGRGAIPEWDNTFNPKSWLAWLQYDAQASAAHLTKPLAIVHSSAAASPESVPEFVAKVPGPVEELWLDDVTQFDFYDQPAPMKIASDTAAHHLERTLR
ncbi:alpha/beta hydrolase [Kribbella antibiotica]|uniref:Alpha/beta hydrolase n=1 Tax=Kribbella antibiotica TaxID=190195 RepID=A0A4R4ZQ75_9ACTN|nr:alpha/beta hydrolase [Kribbella antibiotica]TDD59092.1 alpha/beta hydrolase [Kribbella antibiotica]